MKFSCAEGREALRVRRIRVRGVGEMRAAWEGLKRVQDIPAAGNCQTISEE
jgi:hypothetical protein